MFCSNCGARAEDGARFCGGCGKQVGAASSPAVARQAEPRAVFATEPHAPRRGLPTWISVILGGIVVVVVLAGGLLAWSSRILARMEEPVQAHLEAIRKDDLDAAYALTSAGFHKSVPQAAFIIMAKTISSALRGSTFVASDRRATGANVGLIRGSLVDKRGERTPVAFTVVEEPAGWRVHEINLQPEDDGAAKGGVR